MKKLTAVTIQYNGHQRSWFVHAQVDEVGRAVISQHLLDKLLGELGVRRGDTYSIG